jgi:hypothetical protein
MLQTQSKALGTKSIRIIIKHQSLSSGVFDTTGIHRCMVAAQERVYERILRMRQKGYSNDIDRLWRYAWLCGGIPEPW